MNKIVACFGYLYASVIGTRFVLTCRNIVCADSEVDLFHLQLTVTLTDKEATSDGDGYGETAVVF